MKMGKETDHGTWNNFYGVQFSFVVDGQTFFYGQNQSTNYWFIQELLPDGKMGRETDTGRWNNAYGVQFPFSIKGRTFFYGQNQSTNYWFIQELLPGGKMGEETATGRWNTPYAVQFPFWIKNRLFFYGQDQSTNHWFIQELLPGGKMGPETATGRWNNPYAVQFPFQAGPDVYFYGQNLGTKYWFIQELLSGGKMGRETNNGRWNNAYAVQFPYNIDGSQYFYGQNLETKYWFIQELVGPKDPAPVPDQVTVYIWSYRGKNEAWGHASLKVGTHGPYISWWPQGHNRKSIPLVPDVYSVRANDPQTYQDDVGLEGQAPDLVINIPYLLNLQDIAAWWSRFKSNHLWKTLTQNCSTTVMQALVAGGANRILSPREVENWETVLIWTPADIERYVAAINAYQPDR